MAVMVKAMPFASRLDSPYDAVGALSELLGDGVALVDDKVLVEDLEYPTPL